MPSLEDMIFGQSVSEPTTDDVQAAAAASPAHAGNLNPAKEIVMALALLVGVIYGIRLLKRKVRG